MAERYDPARVTDETREAAFRLILDGVGSDTPEWRAMRARILDESRVPRLRTRVEVDAEIVRHARDNYDTEVLERDGYTVLARLLREPLAPETVPCCGNADTPNPCRNCPRLGLNSRVEIPMAGDVAIGDRWRVQAIDPAAGTVTLEREPRPGVGCKSCGAATFEPHRPDCTAFSYDEATAEVDGPPDPERCGCEETEALKAEVDRWRRKHLDRLGQITEAVEHLTHREAPANNSRVLSALAVLWR